MKMIQTRPTVSATTGRMHKCTDNRPQHLSLQQPLPSILQLFVDVANPTLFCLFYPKMTVF